MSSSPVHSQPTDAVLRALHSGPEGLGSADAMDRQRHHGPNALPEAPRPGVLRRFVRHFHDVLIYVLLGAAAITGWLGHWIDTGVILSVVLINALIGFLQEGKAEAALEGIRQMLSSKAQVCRDGQWREVAATELVPGDWVRLRSGDRVPADLRLVVSQQLCIEESALTGESLASEKHTEPVAADTPIGDRACMAFSGTWVTSGRGTGVVTATGVDTEMGRINRLLHDVQPLATPLTRQMAQFGRQLSMVVVGLAVVMLAIGLGIHDAPLDEVFLAAIGFAVAAIPEGLPAVLTITLALGVQRMARRNAITRKLTAVETLGSVTVICSDKTGTLTRNEMTAREVVTRGGVYAVSGSGYDPQGEITLNGVLVSLADHLHLRALIEVVAVANDTHLHHRNGRWEVTGEPTEGALRTLAHKLGFDGSAHQRHATIPFESATKFMATLNTAPSGERRILLKGAPDRLLDQCHWQWSPSGDTEPLDRTFWEAHIERMSAEGLRVLAAAARETHAQHAALQVSDLSQDMVFLGLIGIMDPPRAEAMEAIRSCHAAGIRVKMITGDHAGTAKAIGVAMGLGTAESLRLVTGAELDRATPQELATWAREADIFARTSPEHKLRLVEALQASGEVVAMTGDGVNDAPALKRADVGIAMGIKGTEATKEAADIVLADDDFSTIERAVAEGRTIYANLRQSIVFILPTNGAQGLVMLAAVVLGWTLPLTPVHILWVNMVVAVTLAMALAFEPAEPGVMTQPPRQANRPLVDGEMLWRVSMVSLLIGGVTTATFHYGLARGLPLSEARTLAVHVLVTTQAFYLFSCRSHHASVLSWSRMFSNPVAWMAVAALLLLQGAFGYVPLMQHWFGTAAVAWHDAWLPLAAGVAVLMVVEADKAWARHRRG